jgi:thimet oligopeptidase
MIESKFNNLTEKILNQNFIQIKKQTKEVFDFISKKKKKRTFKNTFIPMIICDINNAPLQIFEIVSSFYTNKQLREFASLKEEELTKFSIECVYRKDVFDSIKLYYDTTFNDEKKKLTNEEIRLVEHTIKDYNRMGFNKNYEKVKKLTTELSSITTKYTNNLNEVNTSFKIKKKNLDGLPESWFSSNKLIKKNKNNKENIYNVTLKYPDYLPIMKYCNIESTRKKLYVAFNNRCKKKNLPLFKDAIKLRSQIAKELGYKHHADYKTEIKIVKNAYTAYNFIDNLNKKFTSLYEKEIKDLYSFSKKYKKNINTKNKLDKWDINYYMTAYKEEKHNINMKKIKEYFPLISVKNGMFKIYQKILDLKFVKINTNNKWHNDVELYSVINKKNKKNVGHFYLDLFPREGKYGHAAVFPIYSGCSTKIITKKKTRRLPLVAMACNFPKNDCLEFSDVVTFFHEFGHVMHEICSKTQLSDFSGFNIEHDFVEAPSQMLEYWCYENKPLKMMSSHINSKKSISKNIIDKLKNTKNIFNAHHNKRQILFALFDLQIHMNSKEDAEILWNKLEKKILKYDNHNDTSFISSFGHLMGGYDAGYYGYLRSESYASNMFNKVFKNNELDKKNGLLYRKHILEPGSTKDGIVLLTNFLGEKPNDKYFFKEKGL